MRTEHFFSIAFVKSFNKRILVGLARLDVTDLNAVFLAPVDKRLGTELGSVVHPDRRWLAAQLNQLLQMCDVSPYGANQLL